MNFREAEAYLLSLGNEVAAMKLGLESTTRLLAALGNPENKYLKVQVAGTNGKGSVCAFLKAICLEAGIKAGVYTSPHLISITERINVGGVDITEDEFAKFATTVRETAEGLVDAGEIDGVPTFFEQVTAIALLAFADAKVDLAILETGLGGRLDATTAANAEIAAITRIDYDHQEYLGETLAEIAAEKAAIIRPNTKAVIIGEQRSEVMDVIEARLAEVAPSSGIDRVVYRTTRVEESFKPQPFDPRSIGLVGRHQIQNAKIAIMLAVSLPPHFEILNDHTLAGLEHAKHPGRLEYIGRYLLDGAHNVGGAIALVTYLIVEEERPLTIIFGGMKGKDVGRMAEVLFPRAERIILTQPQNPRSMTAGELAADIEAIQCEKPVVLTANTMEAIDQAQKITPEEELIVITGSLYLVGEAKQLLTGGSV